MEDGHNVLLYRLVDRSDFLLVRVIDGRSRAFAVSVVRSCCADTRTTVDRMMKECTIHPLVDDGYRDVGDFKHRTVDT